jgi:hypothetical protein
MHAKYLILATAVTLGLGFTANAASAQGGSGGKMLQRLDTDKSGTVSLAEVRAGQGRWFARLDSNGDGVLSREEFAAVADRRFTFVDQDGNGEITLDEVGQAQGRHKNVVPN